MKICNIRKANELFTPSSPIKDKDKLYGRNIEIKGIISAIIQDGQQIVIYGERGVGKTSLVNIARQFIDEDGVSYDVVHYTCSKTDTTSEIIENFLIHKNKDLPDDTLSLTANKFATRYFKENCLFIIDEFDRVMDSKTKTFFSDLIKCLADKNLPTKIILVGVASATTDLIGKHPSAGRSLKSIPVYPLSHENVKKILTKGLSEVSITVSDEVIDLVANISNGLPYYAQLIGSESTKYCLDNTLSHITLLEFLPICSNSVDGIMDYVSEQYSESLPVGAISYSSKKYRESIINNNSNEVFKRKDSPNEGLEFSSAVFEILYMATALSPNGEIEIVCDIADDLIEVFSRKKNKFKETYDVMFDSGYIEILMTLCEEENFNALLPYREGATLSFSHPYLRSYAFISAVNYISAEKIAQIIGKNDLRLKCLQLRNKESNKNLEQEFLQSDNSSL